jgi:nitroreductase
MLGKIENSEGEDMDILEVIRTRRSIRRYRTTPVSSEILERVLEAARWAPSWANTQCWRFIVVQDSKLRNELAATVFDVHEGRNQATEAIQQAPVVIVACAQLGKSGYFLRPPWEVATDKGDWYMFDVALAMQNLAIVAHSLGLGTVHVGAFDCEQAAAILEVPSGFTVVEMSPLGYPNEQPRTIRRRELTDIVFSERFGEPYGG